MLPEEIVGALVVDSEGYVYGRVEEVKVEGNKVTLAASIEVDVGDEVVDEDALRRRLAERGFNVHSLNLQELVSLAREEGLTPPRKKAERREKIVKGFFPVEEIAWIDKGFDEYIILLSTPREAKYRGIKEHRKPSYREVKNKLALSISRGFFGVVVGVAIGPGELAIRVSPSPSMINWLKFTAELRRRGYGRLEEKFSELINPYKNPKIDVRELSKVKEVMENAPKEVNELLRECMEWGEYVHVPWRQVLKVGDVVILE